jgi:hypothetical protein
MSEKMSRSPKTIAYQAYLLRLWCEAGQAEWRVSLQQAGTQQTIGFATLFEAYQFLEASCERENQTCAVKRD